MKFYIVNEQDLDRLTKGPPLDLLVNAPTEEARRVRDETQSFHAEYVTAWAEELTETRTIQHLTFTQTLDALEQYFAKVHAEVSALGKALFGDQPTLVEFSAALEALKAGKAVRRAGWKNYTVALHQFHPQDKAPVFAVHTQGSNPNEGMLVGGWAPSPADLLAKDWVVL